MCHKIFAFAFSLSLFNVSKKGTKHAKVANAARRLFKLGTLS